MAIAPEYNTALLQLLTRSRCRLRLGASRLISHVPHFHIGLAPHTHAINDGHVDAAAARIPLVSLVGGSLVARPANTKRAVRPEVKIGATIVPTSTKPRPVAATIVLVVVLISTAVERIPRFRCRVRIGAVEPKDEAAAGRFVPRFEFSFRILNSAIDDP